MSSAVELKEEYIPLLTSYQHFMESDIEKDEEEDTRNIRKDTIVVNTNLYALTKDAGAVGKKWQNIDCKELIIWIALVIYQGLFKLPSLNQYWNKDLKFLIHHISK
ncbi:15359_t:CDS:2 [Funneliformis mosseae]|uniref:15359_t:CDS:1 n=1 Tax=Funneliformis mosseae TaxID=27381 RepID=A0A9N9G1Q6_FUNMO|nr:15359_t:CDS:2 [Funneliformis mosseae]